MNIIQSSPMKKRSLIEYLPSELLGEIFLRLPCKDIFVCKSVCKTWYNIISHPSFTRDYANNPPSTSIFLFHHARWVGTSSALLLEVAPDGGATKTLFRAPIPDFYADPCLPTVEKQKIFMIGSCNGLLFFGQTRWIADDLSHKVERVYSYNPLSGDYVLLPEQELSCRWRVQYRIGYIPSTGTIKLLMLVKDPERPRILTVGIDRGWRRLEDRLDYHLEDHGVSFNGKLHWIHGDLSSNRSIFDLKKEKCLRTFDFAKEKIVAEWKLPEHLSRPTFPTTLAVMKNHLTVIEITIHQEVVVHTMEEYGVAESWSRKTMIGDRCYPYLIATSDDGDILFSDRNGSGIKLINPEKEDIEIDVHNYVSFIGILYGVEFSPRFF